MAQCRKCSHEIILDVHHSDQANVLIFLDGDEDSGTYSEAVEVCPGCGIELDEDCGEYRTREEP